MTPRDHERIVERRLRQVTAALFGLGLIALAVSQVAVTIVSDTGSRPEHPDVAVTAVVHLAVLFLPGLGVAVWPRWRAIAFWIVWALGVWPLLLLGNSFPMRFDHPSPVPAWPGAVMPWLLGAIHLGILFVLPIVWGTPPAPSDPPVPVARVHTR
jgi:hypothetical protein